MNKYGRMRKDKKLTPRIVQLLINRSGYVNYNKTKFGADKLLEYIGNKVLVKPYGLRDGQLEVNTTDGRFICIAMQIRFN